MARNTSIKRIIDILLNKNVDEIEEKKKKSARKYQSMKPMTKNTKLKELKDASLLYVPLSQHIGSPAIPVVEIGDYVKKYEKIGEVSGNISANIHSPVSGDVVDVVEHLVANGNKVKTVIIANDFKNKEENLVKRELRDLKLIKKDEIFKTIKEAGIVGLGGAQFPTYIKYDIKFRKVETLIINGAECEPYLTSDYSVMKNYTREIFRGLKVIQKLLNPKEIVIGIEAENSELVEIFEEMGKEEEFDLKIQLLPTIYPQGSELQLINTVTGKKVRKGELPLEKGVVVSNVSTVKAIYDAFFEGKPLIERVVTVSGEEARNIGNYKIKFGTPLYHIVKELKIQNEEKVIFGGPMMGMEIFDSRVPVIKGTSGILFLSTEEIERKNCISCGYCVEVCPMNLMPFEFADCYEKGKYEQMVKANIQNCIECGACEFVCPSRVPLIESIKTGKAILSEMEENK
ncbi:RnfABCDGE type electron transport complex subunit C [Leptotrichia trevisanii]|uniref:Ion-translocating oxidoreductase complex subunit C n=2 Tax=Leptotrichia trevisanii TaxID=109328 RepID=A0A510KNW5_9FUSO|nr:electron transport complex subunit RsxC [Leptotrichia trevisanii]BBM53428.1 RnfABCDGE type electron transport complex subunit C [Leptotrichia trevisanii]BBM58139.1 RnfABCDGE type electron transport complex subunit C [Leptotrichia trevisanii]